ncbi:MAG: hypothetical protein KGL53_07480 [Elusimicrobia bacterium]|nr:hypothetical protein [Elusimicrobiota bacterium]
MADFPRRVELKRQNCPACGDALSRPVVDASSAVVRVVCRKEGCGYAIDLGWLGAPPSAN